MPLSKSLVIAGTHSGSGKTTVSIGIMSALRKRGFSIQPFKVGPDFIDPGYHAQACGIPSRNLDGWMLDKKYNLETFLHHSRGKEISIIEGVMGLYDGYGGKSEEGSTAQIAKWLNSPVILVVDAKSIARSVAALVYGFEKFDTQVKIAGVILNRVGSVKHYKWLKDAIAERCKAKVIGYLPSDTSIKIPERHLGLVTSKENSLKRDFIQRITDLIGHFVDLSQLLNIASPIRRKELSPSRGSESKINQNSTHSVRIGVAYDEAFCFYYRDNFDLLQKFGAELICFSPLRDKCLPKELDGIYLGGGYPELFARDLNSNQVMRREIKRFAADGGIIYAECGGLMYLGNTIKDFDNNGFEMVGVFPFTTRMEKKLTDLGYYTVEVLKDNILSKKGDVIKGHQFRYSSLENISPSIRSVYRIRKGANEVRREGFTRKNVLASYVHIHFGSNINFARQFIDSCRTRKKHN